MDRTTWDRILATADVTRIEAQLHQRAFVFAHRPADDRSKVFIYGNDVTLLRAAGDALRDAERMATLGTLSAGVAHELNNPAAATARSAEQLREALVRLDEAFVPLSQVCQRVGRMQTPGHRRSTCAPRRATPGLTAGAATARPRSAVAR